MQFTLRGRKNKKEEKKKKETKKKKKKESRLGADLKTTPRGQSPCLKDTRPHYQIFTKKLYPITVQGGVLGKKVFENDSKASVQQYVGALSGL